jgi:raffinose/stachyose/melibiose transport system permease protein
MIPPQVILVPVTKVLGVAHLMGTIGGLVLFNVGYYVPFGVFVFSGFVRSVPVELEEAAAIDGSGRFATFWRIVFPLIGPGVSAGLMLSFIIVFNEYLVTLFVHPTGLTTAPLRVFNLIRTAGLAPTTAALAVTMQLISFAAVLLFFKVFGTRYLRGTYLI